MPPVDISKPSSLNNHTYQMSGNTIGVKTLDLDCDFEKIAWQLDEIAGEYFK